MTNKPIDNMIDVAMDKIKEIANSKTVVGEPILLSNGVSAVPVCKVSFGFGAGGADIPGKEKEAFGGGTGGGISIVPIAFLVTSGDSVRIMQLDTIGSTADNIVRMVPETIDRVSAIFSKNQNE